MSDGVTARPEVAASKPVLPVVYDRFDDVTRIETSQIPLRITTPDSNLFNLSIMVRYEISGTVSRYTLLDVYLVTKRAKLFLVILNDGPEFLGREVDLVVLADADTRLRLALHDRKETAIGTGGKRREELIFRSQLEDLQVLSRAGRVETRVGATETYCDASLDSADALLKQLTGWRERIQKTEALGEVETASDSAQDRSENEGKPAETGSEDASVGTWKWKVVVPLNGERARRSARWSRYRATIIEFDEKVVLMISDGSGGGLCCTYSGQNPVARATEAADKAWVEILKGSVIFKKGVPRLDRWARRCYPIPPWGGDEQPLAPAAKFMPVDEMLRRRPWW